MLRLEEEISPKKPGPVKVVTYAAAGAAWRKVHDKIHETEHENVAVEAGHKAELAGEAAIREAGATR